MTTITIDNKEYEFESLSDKAKAQLLQTARMAYSKALQDELNPLGTGDTIKF